MAIKAFFFIQLRHTCLWMAPTAVGWALLHQLAIKKMTQRLGHRPVPQLIFLFLSIDLRLCQVDKKSPAHRVLKEIEIWRFLESY